MCNVKRQKFDLGSVPTLINFEGRMYCIQPFTLIFASAPWLSPLTRFAVEIIRINATELNQYLCICYICDAFVKYVI